MTQNVRVGTAGVQRGSRPVRSNRKAPTRAKISEPIQQGENPILWALSEALFQRDMREVLEDHGYTVWTVPNMKRTMAGLPDVLFWHPLRPGVLHAWELKRERDYRVSLAQREAIAHLATVPGIDARIVRPSDWPALRDALLGVTP